MSPRKKSSAPVADGNQNTALAWALRYAAQGLRVLPLEPRGKRPLAALAPRGVHSASDDPVQLRHWWSTHPDANVGLAAGEGLVVIDVDPRNGGDTTARAFELEHGDAWTRTRSAKTGGGGWHLLLRVPPGVKLPGKLGPGIEIKQPGGYIAAEPSVHPSGEPYQWEDWAAPILDAPAWLLAKAKGTTSNATPRVRNMGAELSERDCATLDRVVELVDPHFDEGQRNQLALYLGGFLCKAGFPIAAAEYVVRQLPSDDPDARIRDAERAWSTDNPAGWSALGDYLPADVTAALGELPTGGHLGVMQARAQARHERLGVAGRAGAPAQAGREQPVGPWDWGWGSLPFSVFDPQCEPEPLAYIWGPFAAGKVNGVLGYAYAGKTPFALKLGLCIALGREFLGQRTERRKVVYVVTEGARNARRKAQRIARALGTTLADLADWFQIANAPSGMLDADTTAELCEHARLNGVGLVLIDTYNSALTPAVERNAAAVSDALRQMGDCSDATGIVFGVLLHCRKDAKGPLLQAIDGHNSIAGALQAAVALTRPDEDDKERVRVSCERAPEEGFDPFELVWVDVDAHAEPVRTVGQRLTAKRDGGSWGLRADVVTKAAGADSSGKYDRFDGRAEELRAALIAALTRNESAPSPGARTDGMTQTEIGNSMRAAGVGIDNAVLGPVLQAAFEAGVVLGYKGSRATSRLYYLPAGEPPSEASKEKFRQLLAQSEAERGQRNAAERKPPAHASARKRKQR